ncbi:hypothetical protein LJK87_18440 [Paenibacillus sp. P25]|nr:hypothetical protein LJK87_18440 [Paenibacillus sp. P25]
MAFRFVLGRAGSGKTTYCLQEITSRLMESPAGRPLIWLVPEQATFQAEYALISVPGLGGTLRAQVLSFRRLAWRVMQEVGGTARLPIDETGKKLLLHKIIHKCKDRLRRFHTATDQMGFLDQINQLFSELKRYCVTADGLSRFWQERTRAQQDYFSGGLEDKLHDLQPLYAEFETELSRLYLDGEDYLTLLAQQMKESEYVSGAEVWVDGFHGFTPQELTVLEQLASHAGSVTLTLCLDRDYAGGSRPHELDLFHPTARTLLQLRERLLEQGVEEEAAVILPGNPPVRFRRNPMLAYLESHWDERVKKPFTPPAEQRFAPPSIRLSAAVNRRAEAEGVARDILRLVRDEGLRWRDIAIAVSDAQTYGDVLAGTLTDFGIPHFFDQKRSVLHHPLVELIRSALEAVRTNWRYDPVFRSVKTGFFLPYGPGAPGEPVIDVHAMDQLENYVLSFGIQGARWTAADDWTYSYRTSLEQEEEAVREADQRFLRKMNACRRLIAGPLAALEAKMSRQATVKSRVEGLYELLAALHVPERLEAWSQSALREGQAEKAREHAQVWDRVIDMFDQMVELMGDERISLELFSELIETGLESIKLGLVPPTLDQVLVGGCPERDMDG